MEAWWDPATSGHDPELQDLSRCLRVGRIEVARLIRFSGLAATEGLVRSNVAQDVAAHRHAGEVHDQVGALSEPHQEPVVVVGGQVDRCGEEALLVADGPDLYARDLLEVQNQGETGSRSGTGIGSAAARPFGMARCCRWP